MKILMFTPFIFATALLAQEADKNEEPSALSSAESTRQSSLYLGYQEGLRTAQKQMKEEDFHPQAYLEGFLLGLKGEKISLSPDEIREAMTRLQEKLTAREAETAKANLEAGQAFLAANETQKGVIKTNSGLQYRIVKTGEGEVFGEKGLSGKELSVHFRGTLPDGSEFSVSDEFSPSKIQFDEAISGFREALTLMRQGDRWVVFIPSDLAYGDQRRSSKIGPNQLLIFEIELVDVHEPAAPAK